MEQLLVMDEQDESVDAFGSDDDAARDGGPPIAVTVGEASRMTGATVKAIRRRIERETLRSVLGADGKRRIPVSELRRAGLLVGEGNALGPVGERVEAGTPAGNDVIDRLVEAEVRAATAELRLIAEQSDRLVEGERRARLEAEAALHQLRTEKDALQHQLDEARAARRERRGWRRKK